MARPTGTPNIETEQIRTIIMLNEAGVGVSRISEITGISRPTVYKYIKESD